MPPRLNGRYFRGVFAVSVVAAATLALSCGGRMHSGISGEIQSVQDLRRLRLEDLRSQVLVRIRGYVTVSDPVWNVMILEDQAGDGVRLESSDFTVPVNQLVEVTGFAASGGNTPTIAKPKVRWLSMQKAPQGRSVRLEDLLDASRQYTKVEVDGVIRGTIADRNNRMAGLMGIGGTVVEVRVMEQANTNMTDMVDEEVRVSGVVETSYDIFGKPSRAILWASGVSQKNPNKPAPDSSALPIRAVSELKQVSTQVPFTHRVRLRGQVYTDNSGSKLYIKDGTGVLPLRIASSAPLLTGQNLDAVGFLAPLAGGWELTEALVTRSVVRHGGSADLPVLTTVAQLHHLSPEEAARSYPVHLRAVITYYDSKYRMLFVQDATGGTFVDARMFESRGLAAGQLADVSGISEAGLFAPQLKPSVLHVIGTAKLPLPRGDSSEDLYTGSEDSEWVKAEGVVRSVTREGGHTVLNLQSGVHRFDAQIVGDAPWADALTNSAISLQGVVGARFNMRKQLLGINLWIPDRSQIRVLWRAPDFGSLPSTPVAQLLQYSPSMNPDSPVRVRGVVTFATSDGPTYIQDSTGAVLISNHRPVALQPGDLVDVFGFAHFFGFSPTLQGALVTRVASGALPTPAHVSADEALDGGFDSQLIQIDAVLLDRLVNHTGEILMLQAGRTLLNATAETGIRLPAFRSGAVLRVTGVCSVQYGSLRGMAVPRALTLLLRSPEDVTILESEPWWTLQHAVQSMGLLAGLALLTGAWVLVLRRRVQHQTKVISEKLAQEENLKLAAEQASRAKTDFLAVMSHEIRTPMNGVIGMTSLLLTTSLDEEQLEFVNTIRSSGNALMTVINDILDFSKIEADKLKLEAVPFDLRLLIRESLDVVSVCASEKKLALYASVDDALRSEVIGDPSRLRQILLNLLSNAIKFTQQGSVTLGAVQEHDDGDSQAILVSITDTGIGITPSQQARLFERFSQGDTSTTRKFGGTGLGLAITKRLVEHMNGSIGIDSQLGMGSTFWFRVTLPLQQSGPNDDAAEVRDEQLLSA